MPIHFLRKKHRKKRLSALVTILIYLTNIVAVLNPAKAEGLTAIEQQINIIDGEFSTSNTTNSPTDNSLGIVNFDPTEYTGDTVYFEADVKCTSCTGGNTNVSASLYTVSDGSVWYDANWLYRKTITIDNTKVSGSGNLTNFPILFSRTDTDIRDNAQSDADDLLFTDSNGTKLDHEIEKYNSTTGEVVSWVRIPTLSGSTDTTIYVYYGNSGASNQQNPTGVWDSNFVAVYHHSETSGTQYDSTSNNNDSASISVTSQGGATGIAGGANDYDGTDDVVSVNDSSSLDISSSITAETWLKFDTLPSNRGPAQYATVIRKTHSVSPWHSYLVNVKTNDKVELLFPTSDESFRGVGGGTALTSTSNFYYIAATRDTSSTGIYLDGADDSSGGFETNDTGGLFVSNSSLNLGASWSGDSRLDGVMDEVRLSNVVRSADWIATTYQTIKNPSTFMSVGSEVAGAVSVSTISTNSTTYSRVRSGALSLSSGDYTVRFKLDATSGTAYIKAARLIIVQSSASITDTQTHIEVGHYENTTATSPTVLSVPKHYSYDHSKYSGIKTAYFEASLKASGGATAYAQLYNRTNGTVVTQSTVSTTATAAYTRIRSPALVTNWDTLNSDEYEVRIYSSNGASPAYIANAKVVIDQTHSIGISKLETYQSQINTSRTQTNTIYTQESYFNSFNPDNFSGYTNIYAYYEATFKTTASTGYVSLYNDSDSDIIDTATNSELTTTSTTYSRQRSANLSNNSDWPSAAKNLDTIIKASSGETTTVGSSWLVIQLIITPPILSFTLDAVPASTSVNGVTTSVTTTVTTVPFGNIGINTPVYASHKLSIETNDVSTYYTVDVRLLNQMQGQYPGNNIDPFVGNSATWSSPQTWTTPTGTTSNVNTGWIGANTSDTDVSGWSDSSGKFGPLDTNSVEIMRTPNGTSKVDIYVTYGIEVNAAQPADTYAGQLIYNVLPVY